MDLTELDCESVNRNEMDQDCVHWHSLGLATVELWDAISMTGTEAVHFTSLRLGSVLTHEVFIQNSICKHILQGDYNAYFTLTFS